MVGERYTSPFPHSGNSKFRHLVWKWLSVSKIQWLATFYLLVVENFVIFQLFRKVGEASQKKKDDASFFLKF